MKERRHDPLKLDVAAFAQSAARLDGCWEQAELPRLASGLGAPLADAPVDVVRWQARGESRPRRGGDPEIWLHLEAETNAWLVCQRCLAPVRLPLEVRRSFLFAADEAQAERLDEELEEDVLVLSRGLDLRELVEDELILALPIVPRHERCPQPLPVAADAVPEPAAEQPHPFAALAGLRRATGQGKD